MKKFEQMEGPVPADPIAVAQQSLSLAQRAQQEQQLITNKTVKRLSGLERQNKRLMVYLIVVVFVLLAQLIKAAGYW